MSGECDHCGEHTLDCKCIIKNSSYETIVILKRNKKTICIFLKNGDHLTEENIVDVIVCSEKTGRV